MLHAVCKRFLRTITVGFKRHISNGLVWCPQCGPQRRPEGIAAAVGLSPAEVSAVFGTVSQQQRGGRDSGGGASLRRLSQLLQRVCDGAGSGATSAKPVVSNITAADDTAAPSAPSCRVLKKGSQASKVHKTARCGLRVQSILQVRAHARVARQTAGWRMCGSCWMRCRPGRRRRKRRRSRRSCWRCNGSEYIVAMPGRSAIQCRRGGGHVLAASLRAAASE